MDYEEYCKGCEFSDKFAICDKRCDGHAEVNPTSKAIFEKELFLLVNNHDRRGLGKADLISVIEWVLGSAKMS